MTVRSILLDFRLQEDAEYDYLEHCFCPTLEEFFHLNLFVLFSSSPSNGNKIWIISDKNPESPLTVDVKAWNIHPKEEASSPIMTMNIEYSSLRFPELLTCDIYELERRLVKSFPDGLLRKSRSLPFIGRGLEVSPYLTTSDDRIVEYKYTDILFSERSKYQEVLIVNTVDHGRLLILDDLVNLAENDRDFYTKSLLFDHEFDDKEILILGGGDGGILKEILDNYCPKWMSMVEIDDFVVKAVRKHMRSVCGEVFDNYKGSNYEVIIGDAFAFMDKEIKDEKRYDFIFGDLTDTPVPPSSTIKTPLGGGDSLKWDLIQSALSKGIQLLKPGKGKYLTHCNGKSLPVALESFEKLVKSLKCTFRRKESFVPSFMETWIFYEISPLIDNSNNEL